MGSNTPAYDPFDSDDEGENEIHIDDIEVPDRNPFHDDGATRRLIAIALVMTLCTVTIIGVVAFAVSGASPDLLGALVSGLGALTVIAIVYYYRGPGGPK